MKPQARIIKKQLKELGYNSKKIRVRVREAGTFCYYIEVALLDAYMPIEEIENLLKDTYEDAKRDELTSEYYNTCSTFVSVFYDFDSYENAKESLSTKAKELLKEIKAEKETYEDGSGYLYLENEKIKVFIYPVDDIISVRFKLDNTLPKRFIVKTVDQAKEFLLYLSKL